MGSATRPQRIVVVASLAWSLINFRGQLLADLVAAGHHVIAVAPEDDAGIAAELAARGVDYRAIPMRRAALSVGSDLGTLSALVRLFRAEKPDVVLAYTQKPIVYAGIAARIVGGIRYFAMVSGLGHAFSEGGNPLVRWLVARLYRRALHRASGVFVFNSDDEREMRRHGMLDRGQRVTQVAGSGIDTTRFAPVPVPCGPPVFLLVARLLRNKGLGEFVAAARLLKPEYPELRWQILGPLDANPASIPAAEIAAWQAEGIVEYLGESRDVVPYFAAASVFVLPTWYREGLPRTILEAMATGRAIITTDTPGCRDACIHRHNGFLVPVRDARALAAAMRRFVDDPDLAVTMGARSRRLAEGRYDVALVNAHLIDTMGLARPLSAPRLTDAA